MSMDKLMLYKQQLHPLSRNSFCKKHCSWWIFARPDLS